MSGCIWPDCGDDTNRTLGKTECCGAQRDAPQPAAASAPMGPVELVEITAHETGWKGTWYSTGERHFVRQDPSWPSVMACRWRALDVAGSIHEHHCRVVRGRVAWLRCRLKAFSVAVRGSAR